VNMMRQWMTPTNPEGSNAEQTLQNYAESFRSNLGLKEGDPRPEPALVRTGNEPDLPDVWGGYNLRTAFMMWDGYCFEDAIVISQSAADKMGYPVSVEVGDKINNRHGNKGVISQVLPDEDMPQLPDGSSVEVIIPPTNIISRMNFGQIREAVMGRIAEAEGKVATIPPFQAPDSNELKSRLKKCGFDEDGMVQLTLNREALPHRSTVGVVYWGRTVHLASEKLQMGLGSGGQQFGEDPVALLVEREALAVASDFLGRHESEASPFTRIEPLLNARGIRADFDGEKVQFELSAGLRRSLCRPLFPIHG
jgi:hypothetical protein